MRQGTQSPWTLPVPTLRELFRLADKNMYVDKNRAKIEEAAQKQQKAYELLEWIKKEKYHFSDCLYCDARMDTYRAIRSSENFSWPLMVHIPVQWNRS